MRTPGQRRRCGGCSSPPQADLSALAVRLRGLAAAILTISGSTLSGPPASSMTALPTPTSRSSATITRVRGRRSASTEHAAPAVGCEMPAQLVTTAPQGHPRDPSGSGKGSRGARSPMWRDPRRPRTLTHDRSHRTHQDVRRPPGRRRRHLHRPAGPGDRVPRSQRRRQVDHHARHGRSDPADLRVRHRPRPQVRRPPQPRPRGRRPPRRLRPARRPHRPRDPPGRRPHHGAADEPGRRDARPGLADRRPRPSAGSRTTRSACASGSASRPR